MEALAETDGFIDRLIVALLIASLNSDGEIASPSKSFSTPTLGLIWFGAAVSLAEILTGTYFAPLGIEQGLAAILLGHLIAGACAYERDQIEHRTADEMP